MERRVVASMPLAICLALLLFPGSAVPASGGDARESLDGKALFERKCSACHRLSLATSRREWKPEWREIVNRMVRKRDGWISAEEAAAIADYLGASYGRD
jgi:cytochrome c2